MTRISLFRVSSGLESLPCKMHCCRVMKKISNKFHQEVLTTITFFGVFAGMGLKLCEGWPNFFKSESMSFLTICCKMNRKSVQ